MNGGIIKGKNDIIVKNTYAEIVIVHKNEKYLAIIDTEDVAKCKDIKWRIISHGYIAGHKNKKSFLMHRFLLGYSEQLDVDHINRNKLDNRKTNLRVVDSCVNNLNKKNGGINYIEYTNKWIVKIYRYGRHIYIGEYDTKEIAEAALNRALKKYDSLITELANIYKKTSSNLPKGIRMSSNGKRYVAGFNPNKGRIYVGTFDTIEEAVAARSAAIQQYKESKTMEQ